MTRPTTLTAHIRPQARRAARRKAVSAALGGAPFTWIPGSAEHSLDKRAACRGVSFARKGGLDALRFVGETFEGVCFLRHPDHARGTILVWGTLPQPVKRKGRKAPAKPKAEAKAAKPKLKVAPRATTLEARVAALERSSSEHARRLAGLEAILEASRQPSLFDAA